MDVSKQLQTDSLQFLDLLVDLIQLKEKILPGSFFAATIKKLFHICQRHPQLFQILDRI